MQAGADAVLEQYEAQAGADPVLLQYEAQL
jgi:hypothetical protein